MLTRRLVFLFALAALYSFAPTKAQVGDIVSVRTRVVFVDTLIQDKNTGAPVADLTRENFEVLANTRGLTASLLSEILRRVAVLSRQTRERIKNWRRRRRISDT